jgi:hypothetical protein
MISRGVYQHYKGNYYQVIGIARHSETLEEIVVYQALYGDYGLWVRPFSMFTQAIIFNEKLTPRFKFISESLSKPPSINNN